ncbi:MAG: hypothetical protein AB7I33_03235 [Gemmatimonadales bacterium]
MRRWIYNLLLYLAGFVPASFLLGFLEGALRGEWNPTAGALAYQLTGWAGSELLPLLLLGLVVVPGIEFVVAHAGGIPRRAAAMLAAPLVAGAAVYLLGTGVPVLLFPVSFSLAAVGMGAGWSVKR